MRRAGALLLLATLALPGCVASFGTTPADTAEVARRGEDRAAIHALLVAYGETLDARDFDGFAALFARAGIYGGGAGGGGLGPEEAAESMRRIFAENPLGVGEPNYHVFFNEVIRFTGPDSATATSKSFWVVPGEDGRPHAQMMAEYSDSLVREDGSWKFARRDIRSLLPAPAAAVAPTGD